MVSITTNELLEAIRKAQRSVKDPGGFTTITEMQDASGMCRKIGRASCRERVCTTV